MSELRQGLMAEDTPERAAQRAFSAQIGAQAGGPDALMRALAGVGQPNPNVLMSPSDRLVDTRPWDPSLAGRIPNPVTAAPFNPNTVAGQPASKFVRPAVLRDQTVAWWMQNAGVPLHVAQGIADNIERESGFRPDLVAPDKGGPSAGLYQAHLDRMENLQQQPNWQDPNVQHAWALKQVTGGDQIATQHWNEIRNAKTREEANQLWKQYFERPAGTQGHQQELAQTSGHADLQRVGKQTQSLIDAIVKEGGRNEETWKRLGEAQDKMRDYQERALKLAEKPPSTAPTDAMQKLGGLATVVGILGGLLTKQPLTASLNAAGAAMEAYNTNDQITYKRELDQWKYHTDVLSKMAQFEHEQYRDILADERATMSDRMNRIHAIAQLLGNERMAAVAQIGNERSTRQHAESLAQGRERLDLQWKEFERRTEQQAEKEPAWRQFADSLDRQWQEEHPGEKIPEAAKQEHIKQGMREAPTGSGAQSPGQVALRAFLDENPGASSKQISDFIQSQRVARSGQAAAVRKFMEENPNATSEDIVHFNAKQARAVATERAFGTGAPAQAVLSMNTVADHLSLLREAAQALGNHDIQRVNTLQNQIRTEIGDTRPTTFAVAREIASDEIARAVIGGVGSETSRENMRQLISKSQSPAQLEANIREAERFIGGRLESLRRQYAGTDPEKRKAFDDEMLSDRAKSALTMAGGGGPEGGKKTPSDDFSNSSIDDLLKIIENPNLTNDQRRSIDARLRQLGH